MSHLTFEQISELAESRATNADGREHLESCAECRATYDRVRSLLDSAHALPRDIAPPPDVWSALQGRVRGTPRRSTVPSWNVGWLAAAAVVVFFVGAALLSPALMGRNRGKGAQPTVADRPSPVVLAVAQNYEPALADLRRTLEEQRSSLSPATLRVIERAVATCDSAIAEARAALAADPANQALLQILSAQFQLKVDLLQRATQLTSS